MNLEAVPPALRARPQWVCWRRDPTKGKIPVNPRTGTNASTDKPRTWATLAAALAGLDEYEGLSGVGYVFAADDEFVGVDLDNCLEEDGSCKLWALPIRALFPGAYTEVTPSGRGLHIITPGTLPENSRHKVPHADGHVEAYDRLRFFTMTGQPWAEAPEEITGTQAAVDELVATVMGVKEPPREATPRAAQPVALDDQTLLDVLFNSPTKSTRVRALWNGDTSHFGGDDSAADQSLCNDLAFVTGRDAERIDRMFRSSGLYRDKWERADYRERTIGNAIQATKETYTPPRPREEAPPPDDPPPDRWETEAAGYEQQRQEKFAEKAERAAPRNGQHAPSGKPEIYTAEDLQRMQFPEMKWVIPGILSEGLCLLAGPPKSAKSAFALQTAIATAAGGRTLGKFQVERGEVLYVALEDTKRRMKDRMLKVLGGSPAPAGLYFAHRWPKLGHGAEDEIMEWIVARSEARLVILDTFGKSRGPRKANGNVYEDDVLTMETIQRLAQDRHVCVLLLHHTNKKVDPEDPFHAISGSEGVSGSTDTNLILRRPRAEKRGTLFVTGKDVDEIKYEVEFDGATMTWNFIGRSDDGPKTSDQAALLALVVSLGRSVTAKEVHAAMTDHGSKRSYSSVKGLMWRLFQDGQLTLQEQGRYALPSRH